MKKVSCGRCLCRCVGRGVVFGLNAPEVAGAAEPVPAGRGLILNEQMWAHDPGSGRDQGPQCSRMPGSGSCPSCSFTSAWLGSSITVLAQTVSPAMSIRYGGAPT